MNFKKIGVSLSSLVILALALAACAPATPLAPAPTDTAAVPTAALATNTPFSPAPATSTPAVNTETPAVAGTTATPAATAMTTGTPATGATNPQSQNLLLMSRFLGWNVQTTDNQNVGTVAGVVVNDHPSVPVTGSNNGDTSVTGPGGPVVGNAADNNTAAGQVPGATSVNGPAISYVVVDTSKGNISSTRNVTGNQVYIFIPYGALSYTSNNNTTSMTVNVQAAALDTAPHYAINQFPDMTAANWDQKITTYWASQGVQIPATGGENNTGGTSNSSMPANYGFYFVPSTFSNLAVNDVTNNQMTTVKDFLIDPLTGQIVYALLNSSSSTAGGYIAVPMTAFTWQAAQGQTNPATNAQTLASFNTTISASKLAGAPVQVDMSAFTTDSTWRTSNDNYWAGVTP